MKLSIHYNKASIKIELEESRIAGVIGPKQIEDRDSDSLIQNAIRNPIDGPSLSTFLGNKARPLCIVNDTDRATPTAKILPHLQNEIGHLDLEFIVASGTHPSPREEDLMVIFGDLLPAVRNRIFIHNAKNTDELVQVGTTSRGTPVLYNKKVSDADAVLVIGSVEPHYFAGFTGGRKSFLPGVAGYESVELNHKLALENGVDVMALEGNPLHEDLEEAAGLLGDKPIFSIQLVLDAKDQIADAFAGSLASTFDKGVQSARGIFSVPIPEQIDVVVAVAEPPLDKNLYQAHKAIENVKSVLKTDGILILIAACLEGIGNDGFARLLSTSDSPDDVLRSIRNSYKLGHHKAARIAELVQNTQLWAVSELSDNILKSLFILKKGNAQFALDEAIRLKPDGKVLIVNAATVAVPVVSSR